MLINKWLNSTAYFDAEKGDGGKTAAQLEREKISINSSTSMNDAEEKEEDVKEEGEKEEDVKEEDEKEDEKEEEKEEEKEADLTAEDDKKELEKLRKQVDRLSKRIGKTASERDDIKKQLKIANESLAVKIKEGEQPLTEEEVERRAEAKATQKQIEKEFNDAQTRLIRGATKADKDFMAKVNELAEEVAPIPGSMIGILDDLEEENGGAVLAYLANNPDEYEEIHTLAIPKMARRLDKISTKLAEENKPKPKPISRVPKPNEPVGANASSSANSMILTGKESQEEFNRKRAAQSEARRKTRGY